MASAEATTSPIWDFSETSSPRMLESSLAIFRRISVERSGDEESRGREAEAVGLGDIWGTGSESSRSTADTSSKSGTADEAFDPSAERKSSNSVTASNPGSEAADEEGGAATAAGSGPRSSKWRSISKGSKSAEESLEAGEATVSSTSRNSAVTSSMPEPKSEEGAGLAVEPEEGARAGSSARSRNSEETSSISPAGEAGGAGSRPSTLLMSILSSGLKEGA